MKDYKKIYNRLIKEVKNLENSETNFNDSPYIAFIFQTLQETINEVSGKDWHNQIMNEKEFKLWKKQIKNSNIAVRL